MLSAVSRSQRRTSLGKHTNGPDVQDCLTYLLQVDAQHHMGTTILLIPLGSATEQSCIISLLSAPADTSLEQDLEVFRTAYTYPNRDTTTFGGALYRAIVEHDKYISSVLFWPREPK